MESFETELELPFLASRAGEAGETTGFHGIFIRAPVVERVLPTMPGPQTGEEKKPDTIVAPSQVPNHGVSRNAVGQEVEVLAILPGRADALKWNAFIPESCEGDIVAVRQGNCFGTSFHPELTADERIHVWWLKQVQALSSETAGPQR